MSARMRQSILTLFFAAIFLLASSDHRLAAFSPQSEKSLRISGELQSAENVEIRSSLPGTATVLYVIPEGTHVKKGELLVELDTAIYERELQQSKIAVSEAEKEVLLVSAEQERNRATQEALRQLIKLQKQTERAEREHLVGKGGKVELEIRQSESRTSNLQEMVKRLETALANRSVAKESSFAEFQLQSQLLQAKTDLLTARVKLKYLKTKYKESVLRKFQLEQALVDFQLKQQYNENQVALSNSRASLVLAKQQLTSAKEHLQSAQQVLDHCRIRAPADGVVVYDRSAARRGQRFLLESGAEVRERQPLIRLPNMAKLQVEMQVPESAIREIQSGKVVDVQFAAFPDRKFLAVISKVSEFPLPASWREPKTRRYQVWAKLVDPSPGLRIGMVADAEIWLRNPPEELKRKLKRISSEQKSEPRNEPRRPRGRPGQFDVNEMVDRIFRQSDKNQDGFLEESELSDERSKRVLRNDQNQDGKLSKEELRKGMENMLKRLGRGGGK